jgi:hypothetical protein
MQNINSVNYNVQIDDYVQYIALGITEEIGQKLSNALYEKIGQFSWATVWFYSTNPIDKTKITSIEHASKTKTFYADLVKQRKQHMIHKQSFEDTLKNINEYIYDTYYKNNQFHQNETFIPIIIN